MKSLTVTVAFFGLAVQAQNTPSNKSSPTPKATATSKVESSNGASAPSSSDEKPGTKADEVQEGPSAKKEKREAAVTSIEPEALAGFEHYAPQLQQLIRDSLVLTEQNLTYTFGGSNPAQGGMDCSGTIWYVLNQLGLKNVPRQSDEMCGWVQSHTLLHRTPTATSLKHPEFAALQPGDLLFWSGTYTTAPRKIPVTHVMLYLGKLKKSGKPVVFGASDGRVYQGERRTGVSVFDFSLPSESSTSRLYGYGLIPGIGRVVVKTPPSPEPAVVEAPPPTAPKAPPPTPSDTAPTAPKPTVATVEDIRPAVVTEPVVIKKAVTPAKATSRSARTTTSPASKAKPTAKSSSSKGTTTKPKAKGSGPVKPRVRRNPQPPTPQEQLGNAAKKVANSIQGLFTN